MVKTPDFSEVELWTSCPFLDFTCYSAYFALKLSSRGARSVGPQTVSDDVNIGQTTTSLHHFVDDQS